jgi:hypothetical protein
MNSFKPLFAALLVLVTPITIIHGQQQAASSPSATHPVPIPTVKSNENWTTPSLNGSDLTPYPPILGQQDDQPNFHRELIRLQWRVNDSIDTFIVIPKGVVKPPVVLYLYNYSTNTDRFKNSKVCAYLTSNGVAAVGFSTAVSGYRFHDRGVVRWFVSDMPEALSTSAHDVQLMINYLKTRNDLDTSRIGVYGQDSGAAVAILAASADPRIKVLDLEDTWGDWPDWLAKSTLIPEGERATYLKPEFLKKLSNLDPVNYLPKLTIPVRNQYSLPQSPVPPDVRKCIEAALPPQAAHTPLDGTFDWIKNLLNGMTKQPVN